MNIKNTFGENLDVLIEGTSSKILIFVHGFGTDKNEGFALFSDLANYLKGDFVTIRFDLSGYGKSEGEDYEFQLQKAAGDLDSVLQYVREHFEGDIYIVAHSLGTVIASILSPHMIKKIVFTSIPNSNIDFVIQELKNRIIAKGGSIDENNLSYYPRSSGAKHAIGKDFWRTLQSFNPSQAFEELGKKTDLIIFKPKNDDVLKNKYFEVYKELEHVQYVEVNGNHNFTDAADRSNLFKKIRSFLDNNI